MPINDLHFIKIKTVVYLQYTPNDLLKQIMQRTIFTADDYRRWDALLEHFYVNPLEQSSSSSLPDISDAENTLDTDENIEIERDNNSAPENLAKLDISHREQSVNTLGNKEQKDTIGESQDKEDTPNKTEEVCKTMKVISFIFVLIGRINLVYNLLGRNIGRSLPSTVFTLVS